MNNIEAIKHFCTNLVLLYVEDDTVIRKAMTTYLQKFFAHVVCAEDGIDGLQKYKETLFDVVITDLSMPKMAGIEMIKKIQEIHKHQAIIITTAHSTSDYLIEAIRMGIDGYIIKPFDYEELNSVLLKVSQKVYKYAQNEEYKLHLEEMVEAKSQELKKMLVYEHENYEKTLFSMVEMIEARDTYTAGHSRRVAEYSRLIAQQMGYSSEECTKIYQAGFLHDIGKVATPDTVLLNPKKLNDIEYKLIQEHVKIGYQILKSVPMFEELSKIVRSHHERYDGAGYPDGLKGDEIHPLSQIMIVADAFDAMTTNRIYKARKSIDEALEELEKLSAIQFHPKVVEAAFKILKGISIDKSISQLPTSALEEERFAYFYRDTLSSAFNHNYLDVMLIKNLQDKKYNYLDVFYLRHFSMFNKNYSWADGDLLLSKIATLLNEYYDESLVFRVFGDDFAVLSKIEKPLEELVKSLEELFKENCIELQYSRVDIIKMPITSLKDIMKSQEVSKN